MDKNQINNKINRSGERGMIITYVIVFGAISLLLISALFGFILLQLRHAAIKVSWNESLDVAEAGMNYYRWCLNNGVEANCEGERDYYNNDGDAIGRFSISTSSVIYCGQQARRTITAIGWTNQFPGIKRKIRAIYAQESVARYSYIINSNVWVGDDHIINGPYHSNGGIRMDGSNQSLMSSAAIYGGQGKWVCDASFGCSLCPTGPGQCQVVSANCVCPGVFATTNNPSPSLFSFPVPPFDFNAITIDLASIKDKARHAGGIYLPKSTTLNANAKGYHLTLLANGTVQVRVITSLTATNGYNEIEGWHNDYFTISNEYLYATYAIPASCSAIFAEDNAWVEGVVKGKVALASANLVDTNVDTSVVLPGSITYANNDGTDGLSLIAENKILIGPQSPDVMELYGIFTAQKGNFGRNHYLNNFKTSLVIHGSVISAGRVGTKWISGGAMISGYAQRDTYYDQNQVYNSPPFTSHLNPDFKIVSWGEID